MANPKARLSLQVLTGEALRDPPLAFPDVHSHS
jgi:hypothetical protein